MDSITRFARALREVSIANGAMVVRGYTSTVFAAIPKILEISGTAEVGSITSFYTALFEADSLNVDPLVEEVKSVTDGHIVLSRKVANVGRYPAIQFLESISRVSDLIVDHNQIALTRKVINIFTNYLEYELMIKLGEYVQGANPEVDNIINRYTQLNKFFNQNAHEKYQNTAHLIAELTRILQ